MPQKRNCCCRVMSALANPRWEVMWSAGIPPGKLFDAMSPSPLLVKYIQDGLIPYGTALVPGCGRGYDVTLLAHEQREALGLDISPTAIAAATSRLDSLSAEECGVKGHAKFSTTSFFDMTVANSNYFDFIYDYTFLCALDPSIREAWADKMAELLRPSTGELLTLIFPIVEHTSEGPLSGPPFPVSLQLLEDLLLPRGFECLELRLLPSELCHQGRDGTTEASAASGVGRWRKQSVDQIRH